MIRTIADLVNAIIDHERRLIDAEKITHPTTIGGMWEDLSRDITGRTLPCDGITVGSGFIEDSKGNRSLELDCVISRGTGRPIHRSEKRIYSPEDVVAVLQVKKSLYGKSLKHGITNLQSLIPLHFPTPPYAAGIAKSAFQQIARVPLPDNLQSLPSELRQLHRALLGDALYPCRILLGYSGFKSEKTFRQSLMTYFEGLESMFGGPTSFPSFIIGPSFAATKNTAMPWSAPMLKDYWPFVLTTNKVSPGLTLLEAIWTRLNHVGQVSANVFGMDLELEVWHPFLFAKFTGEWKLELKKGWEYDDAREVNLDWSPTEVSKPAFVLACELCQRHPQAVDVANVLEPSQIEDAIVELETNGIAARIDKQSSQMRLLTTSCGCVKLSPDRFVVGENSTGRLSRWVEQYTSNLKHP